MSGNGPILGGLIMVGDSESSAPKIADGIFMSAGISNAYLLTIPQGNVAINAGMSFEGKQNKSRLRERLSLPEGRIRAN